MSFRSRLCFGCVHRGASPHNHTLSKCGHPASLKELAWILKDEQCSPDTPPYPRPMTVKLYKALADKHADWPYAYDPQVLDQCGSYQKKAESAA